MKNQPFVMAILAAATLVGCGTLPARVGAPVAKSTSLAVKADPARFFANPATQAKAPQAFSTRPEARAFLETVARDVQPKRDELVRAIRADKALGARVARFDKLTWDEQVPVLRKVTTLESRIMGFKEPELVIQPGPNPIPSFFEFDPARPGTGKVILYPDAIAKEADRWAALLLTVHEVRHSGQFQLAYGNAGGPLAKGFRASFGAQHDLKGQLSFCDFCSLFNEYEAFQAGNYVVGLLSGNQADTSGMGCLSSQYDAQGKPKIDLLDVLNQVGPARFLQRFNELEKPQFGS